MFLSQKLEKKKVINPNSGYVSCPVVSSILGACSARSEPCNI